MLIGNDFMYDRRRNDEMRRWLEESDTKFGYEIPRGVSPQCEVIKVIVPSKTTINRHLDAFFISLAPNKNDILCHTIDD